MLTVESLKKYKNRTQLAADLRKGIITEKDLVSAYSRMRKNVMAQIKKIQKSDIPFLAGKIPAPPTVKDLTGALGINQKALLYETAEMLKFVRGKSYTMPQRREQRRKAVEALRARGIEIKETDWGKWREFIEWFKHTEYAALYDSDSEVTLDVFEHGSNSTEWNKLFREWVNKGPYDERDYK